jgi:hypothetical protein
MDGTRSPNQISVVVKAEEAPEYPEPDGYQLVSMTNGGIKTGFVQLTFIKMREKK